MHIVITGTYWEFHSLFQTFTGSLHWLSIFNYVSNGLSTYHIMYCFILLVLFVLHSITSKVKKAILNSWRQSHLLRECIVQYFMQNSPIKNLLLYNDGNLFCECSWMVDYWASKVNSMVHSAPRSNIALMIRPFLVSTPHLDVHCSPTCANRTLLCLLEHWVVVS